MAKMTEAKKEALAIWIGKGLVAMVVMAAVWFFLAAVPSAIDKELAFRETRTAQHLEMLSREQEANRW